MNSYFIILSGRTYMDVLRTGSWCHTGTQCRCMCTHYPTALKSLPTHIHQVQTEKISERTTYKGADLQLFGILPLGHLIPKSRH